MGFSQATRLCDMRCGRSSASLRKLRTSGPTRRTHLFSIIKGNHQSKESSSKNLYQSISLSIKEYVSSRDYLLIYLTDNSSYGFSGIDLFIILHELDFNQHRRCNFKFWLFYILCLILSISFRVFSLRNNDVRGYIRIGESLLGGMFPVIQIPLQAKFPRAAENKRGK